MYKFQPILKSLIWGGEKIAPYKGIATDQRNIGESPSSPKAPKPGHRSRN